MVLFFLIFSYKPVYFYTNTTLHLKNQNCPNLQNISERRTHFYLQLVSVYIADISTTRKPELSGTLFSFTQKEVGLCHLRIEVTAGLGVIERYSRTEPSSVVVFFVHCLVLGKRGGNVFRRCFFFVKHSRKKHATISTFCWSFQGMVAIVLGICLMV